MLFQTFIEVFFLLALQTAPNFDLKSGRLASANKKLPQKGSPLR